MTSIYQLALGSQFERLHPRIQARFGFGSGDGIAQIGRGVMDRVWRGGPWTVPFLSLGAVRRVMFPEVGRDVPFSVENYAYIDGFGRETVTWVRSFEAPIRRRFDATMVYSLARGCVIDYLGTHQHLAVDINLAVTPRGGIRIRSGPQRFYEHCVGFDFPMLLSAYADVEEWFDEASSCYRIRVDVSNPRWGRIFGYAGAFDVESLTVPAGSVPSGLRPVREERRE